MSALHIPDPVPRSVVRDLCERLGLDPSAVLALEFTPYGFYVTFFAIDAEGRKVTDGQDVARHRVFIPFAEDEAP